MLPFLLACAPSVEPLPPPTATVLEGVQVKVEGMSSAGWMASAGTVVLGAGPARAADVALTGGAVPLEIRAQRSEWDLKNRAATFTEEVVVTRGDVAIRCGTLRVTYKDADHLDTVEATGGVSVSRGGREARADRAVIDGDSGRITLTGAPTLAEGPNRLAGDRITLYLDDERATCEGASGTPCRLVVDGSALR